MLLENVSRPLAQDVEAAHHCIAHAQWCKVVNLGSRHYRITAAEVHVAERVAYVVAKFVTRELKVVQVSCVVDDALNVNLVVAHFNLGPEGVVVVNHISKLVKNVL